MENTPSISELKTAELARRLGINRTYAWELKTRVKSPSLELAVRIEREFGIPVAAWLKTA
jgi:plasmid maintenance system antidote protein VapI